MKLEEIVFRYEGFVVRIKEDFVRIDTSFGIEADDYHIDFENAEDVRSACILLEKKCLSQIIK